MTRLNFGYYGKGRNYSTTTTDVYEAKKCSECGAKAVYRSAKRAFCREHKAEAVYWTRREFGRFFGRITAELKLLGEL